MPITLPHAEEDRLQIAATQAANSAALPRGIGVACDVSNPLTNSSATGGLFGILAVAVPANTTASTIALTLLCSTEGLCEALLAGTVAKGNPLKLDSTNRWVLATTGDRAQARAYEAGVSGDLIRVLITREGTIA
jgi:hypothetical protein